MTLRAQARTEPIKASPVRRGPAPGVVLYLCDTCRARFTPPYVIGGACDHSTYVAAGQKSGKRPCPGTLQPLIVDPTWRR